MGQEGRTPAELRSMFGSNLRILSQQFPSISELSRQLGINRTQFNRYLAGESFPRPDVLARICDFFNVDARVLLEPVENIRSRDELVAGQTLAPFIGAAVHDVSETSFPSGFYRFSRRSFIDSTQFVLGLVLVWREAHATCIRGYEAKDALEAQGLPTHRDAREFRGIIMRQEDGVAAVISRKGGRTMSFNYMHRVSSMDDNFWLGYAARTVPETSGAERVVRMVYEYLGASFREARPAAALTGYATEGDLLPFHRRLLKPDVSFA